MKLTASRIADAIGGRVIGDAGREVTGISTPENPQEHTVIFAKDRKTMDSLALNGTLCIVTPFPREDNGGAVLIVVAREKRDRAFIDLLRLFCPGKGGRAGIAETAIVDPASVIEEGVTVGDYATVGAGCTIRSGTVIGAHTAVGDNCLIGRNCTIDSRVTIYADTEIGDEVCIHAGVVIGSDGFGYSKIDGEHIKIPQIGGVEIEDRVEIGANTTIDRATIGKTRIGRGTKIDNLVQIAHNVDIGENVIICGLCGISGSVTIGNNVILAGAVGLADHIVIEDDVFIGPKAGVMEKRVRRGSKLLGAPARDYKAQMSYFAVQPKMREIYDDVGEIKKKLGM